MPTLGEELKRRREERAISLAEISEETKISSRFLKAIESNNFSILPGGIFTRSFIRAYARAVRFDEEKAIALYHEQIGTPPVEPSVQSPPAKQPPPLPAAPQPRQIEPVTYSRSSRRVNWSTLVISLAIAIFVILIVVAVFKHVERGSAESTPQQEVQQPIAKQLPPPPQTETTPSQPEPLRIQPGDKLIVRIEATTGDCWLKYEVDGGESSQLILKQGQSHDIPPAENEVVLKYGNRQTLKVTVNNREYPFPADAPKFKGEITLSRASLQSLLGAGNSG